MGNKSIGMKRILILFSGIVFLMIVCYQMKQERTMCMGIPVISQAKIDQMIKQELPLGNPAVLQKQSMPYDENSRTLYIPCSFHSGEAYSQMEGQIQSGMAEYRLYFLWEEAFESFSEAVAGGCKFTLYAIDKEGNYGTYGVFFTTLPVLEMYGTCIDIDEREREIYDGKMHLWDPKSDGGERLKVQESGIQWHVRGYSSMSFQKKSLRLSLKKENGENQNLSLAGLSKDDDYILNPMWFDDVKVREKLAMELWNEIAAEKESDLKMSGGEYCEVIINGKYEGLRLLQNKIEKKYLKLGEKDVLLKGQNVNPAEGRLLEEAYEVIYDGGEQEPVKALEGFFTEKDFHILDIEQWIDVQLLILLGNMKDNLNYKNIYYAVQRENEAETLRLIPWDTDMSFGVYWIDGSGFQYAPESVDVIEYRMEYEALREWHPDLDKQMADRWQQLRNTILSEENIMGKIDAYRYELSKSASAARDFNILGWFAWSGEDTAENLKSYIEQRLQILDEYFIGL